MAKEKPAPLFAHKHGFVVSLDNFIQASLNLYQAADMLLQNPQLGGTMPEPARKALQTKLDEWKAATFMPEGDDNG